MHSIYEYEYEVELSDLDDSDIDGGLSTLLLLGLDDLAEVETPLENGIFTLFIDADVFPDVEATYDSPPEHGHAEIFSFKVRINGKLIELPDVLNIDWMDIIAEHVFIEHAD